MAKRPSNSKTKKKQNAFQKLVTKAMATRRSMFVTGLIGIFVFSGIGYMLVNQSSASTDYAAVCGSGYVYDASNNVYSNFNGTENVLGELRLYRKTVSSTNSKYCALTVSRPITAGKVKTMSVSISALSVVSTDTGSYKYYAGPRYTNSISGGDCVRATGYITWGGKTWRAVTGSDYRCDN